MIISPGVATVSQWHLTKSSGQQNREITGTHRMAMYGNIPGSANSPYATAACTPASLVPFLAGLRSFAAAPAHSRGQGILCTWHNRLPSLQPASLRCGLKHAGCPPASAALALTPKPPHAPAACHTQWAARWCCSPHAWHAPRVPHAPRAQLTEDKTRYSEH